MKIDLFMIAAFSISDCSYDWNIQIICNRFCSHGENHNFCQAIVGPVQAKLQITKESANWITYKIHMIVSFQPTTKPKTISNNKTEYTSIHNYNQSFHFLLLSAFFLFLCMCSFVFHVLCAWLLTTKTNFRKWQAQRNRKDKLHDTVPPCVGVHVWGRRMIFPWAILAKKKARKISGNTYLLLRPKRRYVFFCSDFCMQMVHKC